MGRRESFVVVGGSGDRQSALSRWRDDIQVDHPGQPNAGFVRFAHGVMRPLARLAFRPTLEGVENLPRSGPFLLVANHSGGMAIAEILSFIVLYLEQVGPSRLLAGFAHPVGFLFPASLVIRNVGAIPSTYSAAERTLAAGVPILVFPGGDHEALRPIWKAHRVDFGGRKGFLRIAKKAGVPIVPMGIRGSHFTVPILWRSRILPWLLGWPRLYGLKRWPLTLLGVIGALAIALGPSWSWIWKALAIWLWLGSPLILIPFVPWTIRIRVGTPITLVDDSDAQLERVESEVQRLVDRGFSP